MGCPSSRRLDVGLDDILQARGIGAGELLNLGAVLQKHEGGHAGDVVIHGNVFAEVHIDLLAEKV